MAAVPETAPPAQEKREEEEEEEEEDEEPKLKYQRLGGNVPDVLVKDTVSCFIAGERFLIMGTHWGAVLMLDFNGNEIKRFASHSTTVNAVSVDDSGEYMASCADDGKVVINGLYTSEVLEYTFERPVKSVALDPRFAKKKDGRAFCSGGLAGKLLLNTKGWFRTQETVLHAGEGTVHVIQWRGVLIAWANDLGVKIYDTQTQQRITFIDRPKNSPRAGLHRCHIVWPNDDTFIIAWANSVKVCAVRERPRPRGDIAIGQPPSRFVEITAMLETEFICCGVAPFEQSLCLLAYVEEEDPETKRKTPQRPELRVIDQTTGTEMSRDALEIKDYNKYNSIDYSLQNVPHEALYYVSAPKDVVIARPRDVDDHVSWLLAAERYADAFDAAVENEKLLRQHNVMDVGDRYLSHLVAEKQLEKAAEMCPRVIKTDAKLWEKWIYIFSKANKLSAISEHIPLSPPLSQHIYELVLAHLLQHDAAGLLSTIRKWPSSLYSLEVVVAAVTSKLETKEFANDMGTPLRDALAELYVLQGHYDRALRVYLQLRRPGVFDLVVKHNLFDSVKERAVELLKFDEARSLDLLTSHTDRIPIVRIVEQLKPHPRLLHSYLHALFLKDVNIATDFHVLQVELYADFDAKLLLPFLQQSTSYNLEKAYDVVEKRKMVPEMVYILGRMGNTKQALLLIIEELKDVKQAIDFVQQQNDSELWEELITRSLKNPEFISGLLENIGAHVDPIQLIRRIPTGMGIPGLRAKLIKIISDYHLQMSLREGCKEILKADCVALLQRLLQEQKAASRGTSGLGPAPSGTGRCPVCTAALFSAHPESLVSFFCGHTYHVPCFISTTPNPISAEQLHDRSSRSRDVSCIFCQTVNSAKGKPRPGAPASAGSQTSLPVLSSKAAAPQSEPFGQLPNLIPTAAASTMMRKAEAAVKSLLPPKS